MKLQYGIRRLILIQSGSHRFSDFPMDKPVSIHGRNNMGKSQTINGLQFLVYRNVKEMDFGDYESTQSKAFYFKSEYSMIITEIMVKDGVFLYGAYGKGPLHSYDYEHFVIKAPFRREDFLKDGRQLKAQEVFENFERNGHHVYFLNRDQAKHAITGNYMAAGIPHDITLIPIKDVTDLRFNCFKTVYKNLLTMRKINDRDIKSLLLEVFANVLTNTTVDFLKVKAEAFREHDGLEAEIKTLKKIEFHVDKLSAQRHNKNTSSADVSEIKTRLRQISEFRLKQIPVAIAQHKQSLKELDQILLNSSELYDQLFKNGTLASQEFSHAQAGLSLIAEGRRRFELLSLMGSNEPDLILAKMDERINSLHDERSSLSASMSKSATKTPANIRREIAVHTRYIEQRQSQYDSLVADDNWLKSTSLNPDQRQQLSLLFSENILSLRAAHIISQSNSSNDELKALCESLQGGSFPFCGMMLNVAQFKNVATEEDPEEVMAAIESIRSLIHDLEAELNVATDIEASSNRLRLIVSNITKDTQEKEDYIKHIKICEKENQFQEQEAIAREKVDVIRKAISEHNTQMNSARLTKQEHEKIIKNLDQERINLHECSQELFFRDPTIDFSKEQFFDEGSIIDADLIEEYIRDGKSQYGKYVGSSREITHLIDVISAEYSKHSGEESEEEVIRKLVDEVDSLPEKSNMVEKLHLEAIVKMAGALSILDKNYLRLENSINDLNRKINSKKVSNLKSFKLKLIPNQKALDSIKTILSHLQDTTVSIDLFRSTPQTLDQSLARDALKYLSDMVSEINGTITISDLFQISFEIIDESGKESVFTSLDGHASNGTTMTMKSLFNMHIIRSMYDPKAPIVHLPFYVDEATNIDDNNRRSLVSMAFDLGFVPVFASVDPIVTATYSIDLVEASTPEGLLVTQESWIRYIDREEKKTEHQLDLIDG